MYEISLLIRERARGCRAQGSDDRCATRWHRCPRGQDTHTNFAYIIIYLRSRQGAHFGMPAQAMSAEALAFLKSLILHRTVKVQLLSRDQYNRAVSYR